MDVARRRHRLPRTPSPGPIPADGTRLLRVRATDNAGRQTAELVANVRVDNTNPTGSVTAPAAKRERARSGGSRSASNSADGGPGRAAGGGLPALAGGRRDVERRLDRQLRARTQRGLGHDGIADGLYDLRVVTTDNAGNTPLGARHRNVRVDNTNPDRLDRRSRQPRRNVRGVAVARLPTRPMGGSGVGLGGLPALPGRRRHLDDDATANSYPIASPRTRRPLRPRAVTTDNAGNTFTSALIANVRVDNTNPTGSVTAPAASANSAGVVSDSQLGRWRLGRRGGGLPALPGRRRHLDDDRDRQPSPCAIAWDTTAVADGLYDLAS